jgi:hypothetical protein
MYCRSLQLGVADSGELIGLTKSEMEATLETLENMAGELGASVVISREIEVRGPLSVSLSLDSINGMGGKDMNGNISSSSVSSLVSTGITSGGATTDTETSEAEGESENDSNAADPPTTVPLDGEVTQGLGESDPDEIIVRSAPVPITPSFLRRQREGAPHGIRNKAKERTLRPEDFSPFPASSKYIQLPQNVDDEADDEEDPSFGVFALSELHKSLDSSDTKAATLDPSLPPRTRLSKPPKLSKSTKASKQPKGTKGPIASIPTKTPEQIAQRIAEKRAKRDKRREGRKLALMDPVYDHADLVTQDGGAGGINYESIMHESDDTERIANDNDDGWNGTAVSPSNNLMSSLATLKQENAASVVSMNVEADGDGSTGATSRASELQAEPRLIVEALVVRKAGFGRGFVDLSQFDEELSYLPSFSLS